MFYEVAHKEDDCGRYEDSGISILVSIYKIVHYSDIAISSLSIFNK